MARLMAGVLGNAAALQAWDWLLLQARTHARLHALPAMADPGSGWVRAYSGIRAIFVFAEK